MKKTTVAVILAGLVALPLQYAYGAETSQPQKLILGVDDCIRLALKSASELGEAQADIDLAKSRLDEAKSYRYPQLQALAMLGPTTQAHKQDISPVIETDRSYMRFNQLTWFSSLDATLIQPLYTFGKISENMKAATHGIEVDRSRKEQRSQEIAQKVREYYYGLVYAREMKELVQEIQETLTKARQTARKMIEQGSESVDEVDIYKLDAFSGEATKYQEEALKGERLALAALKTRLGLPESAVFDISTERLTSEGKSIPPFDTYLQKAAIRRPEYRQLAEGLKARAALVEAAKANYYPDIFLGGLFSWAYADNRDQIKNPYITDQFRHSYGGVALGARWKIDFGITSAKVANEQAQYNRLLSTRDFANANIPLQLKKFYLELKEAESNIEATKSAYSNAKKWAVTSVANFDFGVGPARDIFEALQAYTRMRAAYFQSIYNYHLAEANLDYATGETPVADKK